MGGHRLSMGNFLFRHRSWVVIPLAIMLIFWRRETRHFWALFALGTMLVAAGESIRLWAVRHIGVISRTRAERLGKLVTTGPYYLVRNPLYIGNLMLWAGFVCIAGLPWMLPAVLLLLVLYYRSISQWEQALMLRGFGDDFVAYANQVRGWIPDIRRAREAWYQPPAFSWDHVLFSERGTLLSVLVMGLALWLKQKLA